MEHTLSAGTIIDGRYEILSVAGSGGMSTVFRAKHLDLGRLVAIKTLDPLLVSDAELFERFKREARVLSELKHPHISMFYSYGVLPSKIPYIAMEYLEGQTLAALLNDGAIPSKRAILLALQICSAMECAHKAGVIHRDLKPQNIFLLNDPEPDYIKLLDFGLAKYETKAEEQVLTKTGELIGTPEFLCPEQCLGRKADERSDIYALCCIMYKMLTGRSPFESDSPVGFLTKHLNESPVNPREISQNLPAGLELVVLKGMEKEPHDRQQSMSELAEQLNSILSNKGSKLEIRISDSMRGKKKPGSTKLLAALLICFTLVGILSLLFAKHLSEQTSKENAQSIPALLTQIKNAHRANDRSKIEQLMRKLESAANLQGKDPFSKASVCCDVAEHLLEQDLKDQAIQMARLALADVNAVSANFSRNNYSALGPATPLVDKFMDSNKVARVTHDDQGVTEARRTDWISSLQKISERASGILLMAGYKLNKKAVRQCCYQIEHMRAKGFVFPNTARLIIDAYQRGQVPLNDCVILAYTDIDLTNLRKNDLAALRKSVLETESAMKKRFGEHSPKIATHHFSLTMDYSKGTAEAKNQQYERGLWLIDHEHYEKADLATARLYLTAGNAADGLGHWRDRYRFYKLSYESLNDAHNISDRAQVTYNLANDRYRVGDYALTMKLIKVGEETLANYADRRDFQISDFALLKTKTLVHLNKIEEACQVAEHERRNLEQQLPAGGARLATLLSVFSQELIADDKCYGKKQLVHSYLHEASNLIPKYVTDDDRIDFMRANTANLLLWDARFGTRDDIEKDWTDLSSRPDDEWHYILRDAPSIVVAFTIKVNSKQLGTISTQVVDKVERLAKQELSASSPSADVLAGAIRILRETKQYKRADTLRALALEKVAKEDQPKL